MSNYLVKIDNEGKATAEERTMVQAIGDSITSLVDNKSASVGLVSTLVTAGLAYGAAVFIKHRHTGRLSFNPF